MHASTPFGWSCFGVLRQYYNYEVGQCLSGHLFNLGLLGLEGGIRLIRCIALLHSFGGCHQCRSNPANLLPYGLGFGWSCFGLLCRYYNSEVGQC